MFKIGDIVICTRDSVSNPRFNLPLNRPYRISWIGYNYKNPEEIRSIKLEESHLEFSASRFERLINFKLLKII